MKVKILLFINAVVFTVAILTSQVTAIPDYELRVLTIGINPVEGGQDLVSTFFGGDAATIEDEAFSTAADAFYDFSEGKIDYQIVDHLIINEFPEVSDGTPAFTFETYERCVGPMEPDDFVFCDSRKYAFDYIKFFNDYEICQLANSVNADEIWIIGAPYVGIYESLIMGPESSFWINGPDFVNTACNKLYPVMGPTYDRPDMLLHNFSHRIESTLVYLFENINITQRNTYFSRFVGFDGQTRRCGNGHFPVNARGEYDISNPLSGRFYCIDWSNFPNHTNASVLIGCSAWGCTDPGWQEFWFSYIPRSDGTANLLNRSGETVEMFRNWWEYILNPVIAKEFVRNSYNPGSNPPECEVVEWGEWSICDAGNQTRTATRTTPLICTDVGGLEESQSCEMCYDYSYDEWSACVGGFQTRTYDQTQITCPGEVIEETFRSCTVDPEDCEVVEWSDWSECDGGFQSRTAETTDPALCTPVEDTETRACTCVNYQYSAWGTCIGGTQTRTYDSFAGSCPADVLEALTQSCTITPVSTPVSNPTTQNPNPVPPTNGANAGANTGVNTPISSPIITNPTPNNNQLPGIGGQTPASGQQTPSEEPENSTPNNVVTIAIITIGISIIGAGGYLIFFKQPGI